MDRRTTLKWMLAALAASSASGRITFGTEVAKPVAQGYGTDPDLVKTYHAGELWPLTFTESERALAAALCAVIIPADERSPSAADLHVQDFIDEWISAPYPDNLADRAPVLAGLAWLEEESKRRFRTGFAVLGPEQQRALCGDICYEPKATPRFAPAARFFARFRDLVADGFYTTPEGMKDLEFVGNQPSASFAGPPPEVLKRVGVN